MNHMERDRDNPGDVIRRKREHVQTVLSNPDTDRRRGYFDAVRLRHRALPELDLDDVDLSTTFLDRSLSMPFWICSMTGGRGEELQRVNRHLAEAAQETGIAMGVGSQRVLFHHPETRPSFELRAYAPDVPLLANLGAVQLRHGFGLDECRKAVEVLGADALVFHLNPLQEVIQAGETTFAGIADRMAEAASELGKPVVAKEVGAGLSLEDAELLVERGITILDVAGAGGTSWSRIEQLRRGGGSAELGFLLQDWGNPTPLALREIARLGERVTLLASGGIRHGLDAVKAMVLGASLCGMARPFLAPAHESTAAVVQVIERLRREMSTVFFLLGARHPSDVIGQSRHLFPERS